MVTDLFHTLEQKLETVLSQVEDLKKTNTGLKQTLAEKELALKEAAATLEKHSREREMIRQKIDRILNRLKIIDTGESA